MDPGVDVDPVAKHGSPRNYGSSLAEGTMFSS